MKCRTNDARDVSPLAEGSSRPPVLRALALSPLVHDRSVLLQPVAVLAVHRLLVCSPFCFYVPVSLVVVRRIFV